MNIILTGDRQIGKSTALSQFLDAYKGKYYGIKTYFSTSREELIITDIVTGTPTETAMELCLGKRNINLHAFNRLGVALLQGAGDIIVIDELGKFELHAKDFESSVVDAFNSSTPVIAAVRKDAPGWIGALKERQDTIVINITQENRTDIPSLIQELLSKNKSPK